MSVGHPTSRAPRAHASTARYADLSAQVRGAGLLERRHAYYWGQIGLWVTAFAAIWAATILLPPSGWHLLLAAALGVVVTQFGFLGHDAAHRQMFRSAACNAWTARILAGGFAGLSYSWWRAKHSRHHRAPNQEDADPDIGPGAIAFTPAILASRHGLAGWFGRHQGWLFFPLLTLEAVNLHVASVRSGLDTSRRTPWRRVELAIVLGRLAASPTVLLLVLPLGTAVAFLATQLAVTGVLLGASFAPAHKGMPIVPAAMQLDFMRRQVMVSRNVRGNRVLDTAMGGLNYQIEHHLFPSMPRCNLRRARPMIKAHCEREGIAYVEVGLLTSYGLVVDYLNHVGLQARDPFDCPLAADLRAGPS